MNITEVRIKLMEDTDDRLRAFCSITFDNSFVIRDLKIIDGSNGPFVAMPSRKLSGHCRKCRSKNHLKARFCNHCGTRLAREQVSVDGQGRAKLYADIAHPINVACRESLQKVVIRAFEMELQRAKLPGYVSNYDDTYESVAPQTPKRGISDHDTTSDLDTWNSEDDTAEHDTSEFRPRLDGAESIGPPHEWRFMDPPAEVPKRRP